MDEFSVQSHMRAAAATEQGILAPQITSVERPGEEPVSRDEGIRPNASLEMVSALSPAFDPSHHITAANSSQISDGAAAVLLVASDRLEEFGLRGLARVVTHTVVGCDPVLMLEGPIPATAKVLAQGGLEIGEIDLYEINEAFASVPLAWLKETGADPARLNVNGGAIALGHPLGASGARLMTHLVHELERRELRFGLQAMCCGGGLGTAMIVERLA